MENGNNKYLRYKAYYHLRNSLIDKVKILNVNRLASSRYESLLFKSFEECVQHIKNPEIYITDSIDTMINKRHEVDCNLIYVQMMCEARNAYLNINHDRKSVKQIEDQTQKILDKVIDDLLL